MLLWINFHYHCLSAYHGSLQDKIDGSVFPRHHHVFILRKLHQSGNVPGLTVHLRLEVTGDRLLSTTLLLVQQVHLNTVQENDQVDTPDEHATGTGMPNAELHFVGSLCVQSTCAMPEGAKTEAPKGLRERNMSLYNVRNYHLRFRRISEVDVLVQKFGFPQFPRRLAFLNRYQIKFMTPTDSKSSRYI